MRNFKQLFIRFWLLYWLPLVILPSLCQADWTVLPESHHQLFDAWGLFFDEQSVLVNYGQARLWSAIGGTMPVFGNPDSPYHPAFVFHASANAGLHYNDNLRLWTETLDARLGIAIEWEFTSQLRASVGYMHYSGHAVDGLNTADQDLMELTLGQEFIPIRIVYDIDRRFRLAGTLKPVVRSYPSIQWLWADQSLEFFPWDAKDSPHEPSPYISLGFEESGAERYIFTYHAQVGVYFGNHMTGLHRQTARIVAGYYSGADPRLKYFEFRNAKSSFGYLGMMFDL